jgi:hypothetical protein
VEENRIAANARRFWGVPPPAASAIASCIVALVRIRVAGAVVIVVAACTAVESAPVQSATADRSAAPTDVDRTDTPPASATRFLIGVLGERGRMTCANRNTREWIDVTPAIGSVTVSGVPGSQLDPLMGSAVIADGTVTHPPPQPASAEAVQPCPPAQMRSDWIETPRGIVVRRGDPPAISHFAVHALRRLTELSATVEGDDVVVSLTNPLPNPLTDLRIVVHYEGCFGKPGTTSESVAQPDLDPKKTATARVRALRAVDDADPPPRAKGRSYAAHSVQILANSPSATLDLDVRLAKIGAPIDCPDE